MTPLNNDNHVIEYDAFPNNNVGDNAIIPSVFSSIKNVVGGAN
jgi:hypothetical protein